MSYPEFASCILVAITIIASSYYFLPPIAKYALAKHREYIHETGSVIRYTSFNDNVHHPDNSTSSAFWDFGLWFFITLIVSVVAVIIAHIPPILHFIMLTFGGVYGSYRLYIYFARSLVRINKKLTKLESHEN